MDTITYLRGSSYLAYSTSLSFESCRNNFDMCIKNRSRDGLEAKGPPLLSEGADSKPSKYKCHFF